MPDRPRPTDEVWKDSRLVQNFLSGVRGGIPYAQDQLEMMIRLAEARQAPVERILDLGSGAGTLAGALLAHFPQAAATLVDFSEPMMAAARDALPDSGGRHAFVLADFGEPAWVESVAGRAPFDLIVSGYAIHHQPDERKRSLYGEILDLLAPGGLFVNIEHVASATPWVADVSDQLLVDWIWAYHDRIGSGLTRADVTAEFVHRPDKEANILALVEDQVAWLRDLGYADADCYFKTFEMAVFGGRKPLNG